MTHRTVSYFLFLLGIFISIIFINKNNGSYGLINIYTLFLFVWILFFEKNSFVLSLLSIDKVVKLQLGFFLIIILSYIYNLKYYNHVEQVYYSTLGNSPPYLYFKICATGIFSVFISWFGYKMGSILITNIKRLKIFIWTLLLIIFTNSLVNLIVWAIQTGGELGRYNFDPPITGSPGLSIQLSIIGFIIGLSFLKFYKQSKHVMLFLKCILFVMFSNIIIIFTRQSQIAFLLILTLYYLLNYNLSPKKVVYFILFGTIALSLFVYLLGATGNLDFYLSVNSTDAVDVSIRVTAINSAFNIFLNNPIFGVGYGMFPGHNMDSIFVTGLEVYLASPHNGILSLLSEFGIVGLLYYLYLNTFILIMLNRIRTKINNAAIQFVITSIFSILVVSSLTMVISNSSLYGPPSEYSYTSFAFIYWILIGACFSIPKWEPNSNIVI